MKHFKRDIGMMLIGMALGAALFGGVSAVAAGITAEPSWSPIYVDGQQVSMTAYNILGNNYVKLRDIGQAVGFNVYWDNGVQVDSTAPYTGEAPVSEQQAVTTPDTQPATEAAAESEYRISTDHWSREDFSQQANPAVFTGVYSRELYNTIRQTMVDGTSERPAYTMVAKGNDYSAVKNLIGRMEGVLRYEHYVPGNLKNYYEYLDYFAVSAEMPENYQAPLDFIQPVIQQVNQLASDRKKVEYLNDYLCTLLRYNVKATAGITQTFTPHTGELEAACGSYARAMKFLCAAADIPCISISTQTHGWNLVYVDGQWLHVDVSTNDISGQHSILLLRDLPERIDRAPEATAFLQELYVPGSTK